MKSLNPPAGGDGALVLPAARLSAGYTCSKSNDSVYLALAEQLAADGEVVEVVTFDDDQARRVASPASWVGCCRRRDPPPRTGHQLRHLRRGRLVAGELGPVAPLQQPP